MEDKKETPQDKLFRPLVEDINNHCNCRYRECVIGYDDKFVANFITVWCLKNDIHTDTLNWDILIDYLWENLDSTKLMLTFEDKYDFDLSCGRYLC